MLAVVASFIIECYLARNPAAVADALARAQCTARLAALGSVRIVEAIETTALPREENSR
jgi:hypothetical protein